MRFIRPLLIFLAIVAGFAALLLIAALSPTVQTWLVEREFAKYPDFHATVEEVSAGFSSAEFTNLRVERSGVVLFVPTLTAQLPMWTAVKDRKLIIRSLVAKGWTITSSAPAKAGAAGSAADASHSESDAGPASSAASTKAQAAASTFRGLLRGLHLPFEGSVDGLDLEGDIQLPLPRGGDLGPVHLHVTGGGLTGNQPGNFTVDASGPAPNSGHATAIHANVAVGLSPTRTIHHVEAKGTVSPDNGAPVVAFSDAVTAVGDAGDESYVAELGIGDRRIVSLAAKFLAEKARFEGTWKLDAADSDLASVIPQPLLHVVHETGEGGFDSNLDFSNLHVAGRLRSIVTELPVLARPPPGPGAIALDADFDLKRSGQSFRIDRIKLRVADAKSDAGVGPAPVAVFDAIQPFGIDLDNRTVAPSDPSRDLLQGSLHAFPLAWLPSFEGFAFTHGTISGDFTMKDAPGGVTVRAQAPLQASGVDLTSAGQLVAQGLDISAGLIVDYTGKEGAVLRTAPLVVSSAGRRVAMIDAKIGLAPDAYGSTPISGTWSADLDALAAQPAIARLGWVHGRSASGEFSANVRGGADVTAKVTVTGHNPTHSIRANVSATIDDYASANLHIPIKIALGANTADVSVEGTWAAKPGEHQVDLQISSPKLSVDHLRLIAAAIPTAGGMLPALIEGHAGDSKNTPASRDQRPFWGDLVGRVRFDFNQVEAGKDELNDVGGTLGFQHDALSLHGCQGVYNPLTVIKTVDPSQVSDKPLEPRTTLSAEGTISFDAAADAPYRIKATGSANAIDGTRLFGPMREGHDPQIEGHFVVTANVMGGGRTLPELMAQRQQELKVTSTAGIIRFLKTNVAESLPDAPSPGSDALAGVGHAVGALFGIKERPASNGPLSPATEAVLNFTYQTAEIGYDRLAVTATRDADGTIRLSDIAMTAADEHLTGSGEIAFANGRPFEARPLHLELQLGFKGHPAERLKAAKLLSADTDDLGYTKLRQAVSFGGTLEQIDNQAWNQVLVKAAQQGTAKPAK